MQFRKAIFLAAVTAAAFYTAAYGDVAECAVQPWPAISSCWRHS